MDVLDFNYLINQLLDHISKQQKQIFFLGDFNINLLNYNELQPTNEILDSLDSNSIIPYILRPTRLTSILKPSLILSFQMYFHVKQYLETLLQPYHLPLCNKSNIPKRDWSKFNKAKKILFLITLIKIGLKISNLINIIYEPIHEFLSGSYECNFRCSCAL